MIFISVVVPTTDTRGSKERSRMRNSGVGRRWKMEGIETNLFARDKLNELNRIEDFKVAILICHWSTSRMILQNFPSFSRNCSTMNHYCARTKIYICIYYTPYFGRDVVLHVGSYYSFKREAVWNSSAQTRTFSIYITSWNIGYYFSGKSFLSYSHRKISDVYFTHWEV